MVEWPMSLSFVQPITLSLSLIQRMASNDDDKHKIEEDAESLTARKWLWLSDDDDGDDDSSDSSEEEVEEMVEEEEVSSKKTSMNQLDTSKDKLYARHAHDILFSNDGDTPSTSSEPRTTESSRCSDEESSDDDSNDFLM
jgi:hypothetical protein